MRGSQCINSCLFSLSINYLRPCLRIIPKEVFRSLNIPKDKDRPSLSLHINPNENDLLSGNLH